MPAGAAGPRVLSVNVGRPRDVPAGDAIVRTGIFKVPVEGRVGVRRHNLDGDEQADRSVHGGPDKAIYAYPSEHAVFWSAEIPDLDVTPGAFGENLTTGGLLESETCIGDRLRIGTAVLRVTQPRLPCHKLAIRTGRKDMIRRFLASGRSGFYLAVDEEGDLQAGDAVEMVARDPRGLSVRDVVALVGPAGADPGTLRRALDHPALAPAFREILRDR